MYTIYIAKAIPPFVFLSPQKTKQMKNHHHRHTKKKKEEKAARRNLEKQNEN